MKNQIAKGMKEWRFVPVSYWTEIVKKGKNKGKYTLFLRLINKKREDAVLCLGVFPDLEAAERKIDSF